jgi:hypothetical protein
LACRRSQLLFGLEAACGGQRSKTITSYIAELNLKWKIYFTIQLKLCAKFNQLTLGRYNTLSIVALLSGFNYGFNNFDFKGLKS